MKNWIVRSLTGIVYVALIVAGVLLGGIWIYLLGLVLALPAVVEFRRLCLAGKGDSTVNLLLDLYGAVAVLSSFTPLFAGYGWVMVILYFIARLVAQVFERDDAPIASLTASLASLCYVAAPVGAMVLMGSINGNATYLVLLMFVLIWLNDTGAFVVGCTFGRHRLYERISPKKSWEGFWGGFAFAVIAAVCAALWVKQYSFINPWVAAGFGAIVSVAATLGDLVESALKRAANVKDSGNLLPGHGGMLDRIDSLLLVAPATFLFFLAVFVFF